jgi:hypothetical protein
VDRLVIFIQVQKMGIYIIQSLKIMAILGKNNASLDIKQ